jgi:hypothetical protein
MQVWSLSVSNEGHFTLEAETDNRPYLASHSSEVSETVQVELPALALQAVQDSSKSISNKGHFTLLEEKIFCPCLAWLCSRVIETSNVALPFPCDTSSEYLFEIGQ